MRQPLIPVRTKSTTDDCRDIRYIYSHLIISLILTQICAWKYNRMRWFQFACAAFKFHVIFMFFFIVNKAIDIQSDSFHSFSFPLVSIEFLQVLQIYNAHFNEPHNFKRNYGIDCPIMYSTVWNKFRFSLSIYVTQFGFINNTEWAVLFASLEMIN